MQLTNIARDVYEDAKMKKIKNSNTPISKEKQVPYYFLIVISIKNEKMKRNQNSGRRVTATGRIVALVQLRNGEPGHSQAAGLPRLSLLGPGCGLAAAWPRAGHASARPGCGRGGFSASRGLALSVQTTRRRLSHPQNHPNSNMGPFLAQQRPRMI